MAVLALLVSGGLYILQTLKSKGRDDLHDEDIEFDLEVDDSCSINSNGSYSVKESHGFYPPPFEVPSHNWDECDIDLRLRGEVV